MCSSQAAPWGVEDCSGSLAQWTMWVLCGGAGWLYTHRRVNLGPLLNCCLSCCSSASIRPLFSDFLFFLQNFFWKCYPICIAFIYKRKINFFLQLPMLYWICSHHSHCSVLTFIGLSLLVCVYLHESSPFHSADTRQIETSGACSLW